MKVNLSRHRCQLALAGVLFGWGQFGSAADQPATANEVAGLQHWQQVQQVLTHPRCLNCHVLGEHPRQADDRHPHWLNVLRGPDNHGVPAMLCMTCHQAVNQSSSGVPGASGWQLAPRSMAWEGVPGQAMRGEILCATLTDRQKNGGRDGPALLQHIKTEPLVLWGWEAGSNAKGQTRTVPPISHQAFVAAFTGWVEAGMPCPRTK